jgi:GNAT superfamily N-acetyltransferase
MAFRITKLLGSLQRRGLRGTVEALVWKAKLAFNGSVTAYRLTEGGFLATQPLPGDWRIQAAPESSAIGDTPSHRTCYTLLIGDDVAGRGFAEVSEDGSWHIGETNSTLSVPTGSLLLTGFKTQREFRRRGVYVSLMSHILAEFFARGGAEAYIGSLSINAGSRRAIEKLGFTAFAVCRPA